MENKNVKRECQIAMVSENGGDQIGPGGLPSQSLSKFGKRSLASERSKKVTISCVEWKSTIYYIYMYVCTVGERGGGGGMLHVLVWGYAPHNMVTS